MSRQGSRGDEALVEWGPDAGKVVYLREHIPRESCWLVRHGNDVIKVKSAHLRLIGEPVTLDPGEPDPVAMVAPRFAKGQRVTVVNEDSYFCNKDGVVVQPVPACHVRLDNMTTLYGFNESELEAIEPHSQIDSFRDTVREAYGKGGMEEVLKSRSAFDPPPSVATVLEGAARWQQAAASRRRVEVQLQGHTVLVWVTLLDPAIVSSHVQFLTPESAETTHDILDHAAKMAAKFANLEYVNARNPRMRFPPGDIG